MRKLRTQGRLLKKLDSTLSCTLAVNVEVGIAVEHNHLPQLTFVDGNTLLSNTT